MNNASVKSAFLKNFSFLFLGLVLVQIINFIFSLVLPKYFQPVEFAEFGIFTSIVFILIEIANAKLDIAVMLGKNETETTEILNAAFTITIVFFIILLLAELLFLFFLPSIYLLIPFCVLLYGTHQPILVILNKQENYTAINLFRIIQVLSTCTITLVLGFQHIEHALVYGFIAGIAIATLFILKYIRPKIDLESTGKIWKTYDQFPKYATWSSLLNNISRNSVPILLANFFSQQFVGFYSYATRLLNAPTGMYTSALGQIYFKKANELDNTALNKLTQKIATYTFLVSILPTLFILIFGKELFSLLFSSEWMEAGKVSQYLIIWYFLGVISSPLSYLLDIKNKLKFEFRFNAFLFIFRVTAIVTGGFLNDFYLSILLFSAVGIIMNVVLLFYIKFHLLKYD